MGRVIPREDSADASRFSFEDLEQRGRQIVAQAQEQARTIIAQAHAETQKIAAQARQDGAKLRSTAAAEGRKVGEAEGIAQARAAAHKEAVAEARAQVAQAVAALTAGLAEFEREKRGVLALAESGVIELALAIARRVCKVQSQAGATVAQENARALLETAQHHGDLVLRFHPADAELLRETGPQLWSTIAPHLHVTLETDAAVARGGCILATRTGTIDATLNTQLDRIAAALCQSPTVYDTTALTLPMSDGAPA